MNSKEDDQKLDMPKHITCLQRLSNGRYLLVMSILPVYFDKINARIGLPPHESYSSLDAAERHFFAEGFPTFRNETLVNNLAFKLIEHSGEATYSVN